MLNGRIMFDNTFKNPRNTATNMSVWSSLTRILYFLLIRIE